MRLAKAGGTELALLVFAALPAFELSVLGEAADGLPAGSAAAVHASAIGPYGGSIWCLVVDTRGDAYAGVSGKGVYRRSAEAEAWSPANRGIENEVVLALAADPFAVSTLYAATFDGVFKTTDGGNSWQASADGLVEPFVRAVAVDPKTSGLIYAATAGGVFQSSDAGLHWSMTSVGLSSTNINAMAIDPSNPGTLYAGLNGGGVFKSLDGGEHWFSVNFGLSPSMVVGALVVDPVLRGVVYAVGDGAVYKSTSAGAIWAPSGRGLEAVFVHTLLAAGGPLLYVGTDSGVFRSLDGGATWREANAGLGQPSDAPPIVLSFALDPGSSGLYAGVLEQGVFRSGDSGQSWTPLSTGVATLGFNSVAIGSANPIALYAGGPGLYRTVNRGSDWQRLLTAGVNVFAVDERLSRIVVGAGIGVYRSVDGGESWSQIDLDYSNNVSSLAVSPSDPGTLYAGTFPGPSIVCRVSLAAPCGGAYRSEDGGATWNSISAGLPEPVRGGLPNLYVSAIAVDPTTSATVYLATSGHLVKSNDSGKTWTEISYGASLSISSILIDPGSSSTLYIASNGAGILKSVDGGATWAAANAGLPSLSIQALVIDPLSATLYVGTDEGLSASDDGAKSWSSVQAGLSVKAIAVSPGRPSEIDVGTPNGVYRIRTDFSRVSREAPVRTVAPRS